MVRNMGALTFEKIRKIKEIIASAGGAGYTTSQIVEKMNSDLNSREVEWFCRMSDAIIESKTDKSETRWVLKNSRKKPTK